MLSKFPKITPLIGDIGDLNPGLFIAEALGKVKLNVGGKGLVESQSSFGSLRKQEVDLQQLIGDAQER